MPTIGYDCCEATEIAPSVFGGIKKDGKDVYIVTRPSDGDIVLLYYTSEFDVLEYVNAEFWYEDGGNTPKQITLGQLLKKTGITEFQSEMRPFPTLMLEHYLTPLNQKH